MKMPRVRFTVGGMMVAVAITALVSLVASNPYRRDGISDGSVIIPVASIISAVYGFGAMRQPLPLLLPLLAASIFTPEADHPQLDVINVSAGGCFLGWAIGAPAGWMARRRRKAGEWFRDPPEPDRGEICEVIGVR